MAVESGQITVTTAGTAVQGPGTPTGTIYLIKAHPDNTDTVWFGDDGASDVSSANGYPLDPGDERGIKVANLSLLWFDADVNGEKFTWLRLLA